MSNGPVDCQHLLAAVDAIYTAAVEPSQWPEALQVVADCFGDVGGNLIFSREDGSSGVIVTQSLEDAAAEYRRSWWKHDLRIQRSLERGHISNLDTVTDRHLLSAEEIASHPFYADYLLSFGLKWFAGTTVCPEPRAWVALSVQRAADKPPFSDSELAVLARIGRHAENSLRLGIRLLHAELATLTLGDALSRLGVGVFLIDHSGKVGWMNPRGEGMIGDGLLVVRGQLTARFGPECEALHSIVSAAVAGGGSAPVADPRPVIVHGLDPNRFLAVYVLPLPGAAARPLERWLTNIRALVVAVGSSADAPPEPAIVRDLLGLTLAEARLAALVGAGVSPREAAGRLGVSEETARTTLKRVFVKTGISRQSELAILLERLVLR